MALPLALAVASTAISFFGSMSAAKAAKREAALQRRQLQQQIEGAQLAALRTKQSGELNKRYTTTAVAKKRLKPKGKAVPKPKLPSKPRLPSTPPIPSNKQLQPQTTPPQTTYQPNPIGTNEKPSTQAFGASNNFLPIRPTPYKTNPS